MITKKKIFTLCLLLVLLSMASVNAVDDNMTIQTGDSSNELITKNEADIPDVKSDYTEEDPLSFEYLQRDIDNASEGDEIELNNDYSLEEGGTTITKTTFSVFKAINNVVINVTNVTYGEESVILISADADGVYNVKVNGTNYDVSVVNGVGNKSIRLNAGKFYANVTFENEKYDTHVNNATFYVYKANVDLAVVVLDEVYPDEIECIVYASRDGEYNLRIADHTTTITVKDNIGYYEHKTLDVGSYQAFVSFSGDDNYNPAFNITTFIVYPVGTLFEVYVNPGEVIYGQTAVVSHKLSDGATGSIKYYLNSNIYLDELDVKDNLTLPVLNVGNYVIITSYSGDHIYIPANDTTHFIVEPAINNVIVNANNVTYGENTLIELTASVDGDYTVDVNGNIYNITVKDGVGNKTLSLDAGSYYANVTFNNKNYITNVENTIFTVNKAPNNIKVTAQNVTYGKETTIEIRADVDGDYQLDVNKKTYDITVNHGVGNKTIRLNAGNYYANVTFDNKNYNTTADNTIFTVYKADVDLVVEVFDEEYPDEIECIVYASRDGEYNLTIADHTTTITVKNNIAYYEHKTLNAGNYEATVSYNGDENHNPASNKTTFTVYPQNTLFKIEVNPEEVIYGETATVTHNLTTGATGTIKYYLSNETFLDELDVNNNLTLPVLNVGSNVITAIYSGDKNHISANDSTSLKVKAANNNVIVNANNVTYGENTLIELTASVDGDYTVDVNGKIYNITVKDGVGNKTLSLDAGPYYANVTFNNKNYNSTYHNTNFEVYKANTNIEIVASDITYPQELEGTIQSDVDGKYYLTEGNYSIPVIVNDSKGSFNLGVLDTGSYNIVVNYSGDNNHNPATKTKLIQVNPAINNAIVMVNNVTYGEDTLIEVSADVDGVYKLDVNGKLYNITTNNAVGNKTLSLNAGIYYANVTLDNKNYNSTYHNTNFKVYKANTNIEIVASDITYPQELEGTIQSDVDGKYYLTEGNYSIPVIVNDSKGSFNLGVLDTGSYNIVVNYSGDNNHNPATKTKLIQVNPAINNAIVMVNNVTYGEDTLIEVSADVDGTYQVDINQTVYDVCIINGTGNITVTLNAGIYYANISYNNKNYNTISHNSNFEVYKACTNIFVVSPNIFYSEELEGYVYSNVDGMYNLSVVNYSTVINITDGIGEFNAGIFEAGEYMVSVSYGGDENHYANTSSNDVVVEKLIPEINLEASDINYGEVEIINITCTVPGSVNVTVNNITKTLKLKSQSNEDSIEELNEDSMNYYAPMSLYDLNSGTYPVMVVYNGDKNIECVNTTGEFKVNVLNVTMDIESYDIYVGEDEKITVKLSSDVNGTVSITVDESTYSQSVKDAKAIIIIPDLTAGEKIAEVYYSGDINHNPVTDYASFTVNKKESVISVKDHISYIGENITFTAKITDNDKKCVDGGKVVFKLNDVTLKDAKGEPIYTTVEDGIAIISYYIPTSFHAKDYKLTVVYGGNDEYLGSRNNASLQLLSRLAQLTLATNEDVKAGQTINFHVTVTDQMDTNRKVNGNVIFKINGITLKDENEETLQVEIIDNTADYFYTIGPDFPARQHTITAVLINRSYVRSQTENQFNVKTTEITINLNNITTNTQTAQITGTITDTIGKNVIGTNKVAIKIDGITIKNEDNTTQIYYANDGIINITLKTDKYKIGKHIIEVVTPARSSYTQARKNTTLTITNMTNTSTISKQAKTINKTTTTTITNNTTNYNKIHNDEKQNIKKSTNIDTKSNINTNYNTIKSYKTNKNTFNTFENKKLSDKGNAKPDTYVTLAWLKDIFKDDFKNKTLLIYIDNILVYNATTSDDNSEILFKVLEQYEGKHLLKVVGGNESYEKEVNLI